MPEANRVRWVGIRPTNPEEDIPIKTGSAGAIDVKGNINRRRVLLKELHDTIAAGANKAISSFGVGDYERIYIGIVIYDASLNSLEGSMTVTQYIYTGTEDIRIDDTSVSWSADHGGQMDLTQVFDKIAISITNSSTSDGTYWLKVWGV